MDELTSIIIKVIAEHQNEIMYGELICCFSPSGNAPLAKVPMVNMSAAAKYRYTAGLRVRFWTSNRKIFQNIFV